MVKHFEKRSAKIKFFAGSQQIPTGFHGFARLKLKSPPVESKKREQGKPLSRFTSGGSTAKQGSFTS